MQKVINSRKLITETFKIMKKPRKSEYFPSWKIKSDLKVKLSLLILLTMTFALQANSSYSQNTEISLEIHDASVESVIEEIEKKTEFKFIFNVTSVDLKRNVTISVKKKNIQKVLDILFRDTETTYEISDRKVLLKELKSEKDYVIPNGESNSLVDQFAVTGTVLDNNGIPLPGATIVEKGTTNGTQTDFDGNFSIEVASEDATLSISYIGYQLQEIVLNGKSNITVTLEEDSQSLDEVVVVGYGSQKKADLTGSQSSVDYESLSSMPVSSFEQALSGQAAGVSVNQVTGTPGGAVRIQVRGNVSVSSNSEPLYVVDGFPIASDGSQNTNPLSTINPNDIESIEILKDASASAIYGSRASNGVVIITTKSGRSGKTKISLDMYSGIQQVERKLDMLNAQEAITAQLENKNNLYSLLYGNEGASPDDNNATRTAIAAGRGNTSQILVNPRHQELARDFSQLRYDTDWQDEIFRSAIIQNIQLSASGGNEKTRFFASGNYFDQEGIILNSGFKRYNIRTNLTTELNDRLNLGLNLTTSLSNRDIVNAEGSWHVGGIVASALMFDPSVPVRDENGNFTQTEDFGNPPFVNPVQNATEQTNSQQDVRFLGNLYLEYEISDKLKIKGSFGTDLFNTRRERFAESSLPGRAWGNVNQADEEVSDRVNFLGEFTVNYTNLFKEKHSLDVLAGYTFQQEDFNATLIGASNFPNDLVRELNAGVISSYNKAVENWSLVSYLARVNYSYDSKYLLGLSVRTDGSSRFGENSRFGTFPSASIGWNIAREKFLENTSWLDQFKLRTSYGLTGNNSIGNYSSIGLLNSSNYSLDGQLAQGLVPVTLENEELGWESTSQFNIGADISILSRRLNLTLDYYIKNTEDLLLQVPIPSISGFQQYLTNIGEVQNKGWEVGLRSYNIMTDDFKWDSQFNIFANRNEVISLGRSDDPIISSSGNGLNTHITQIGSPISSYFGYVWDGIFNTQEEINAAPPTNLAGRAPVPGDVRIKDVNGDGVIDADDQTVIGDWQADFSFGFTNNFSYKGLNLSIVAQGKIGHEVFAHFRRNIGNSELFTLNMLQEVYDGAWRSPENPGTGFPRLVRTQGQNATNISSTNYVEDASYLRIQNIMLSYDFNAKFLSATSLEKLRLYFGVQNAFLFTNYSGYNPETETTTGSGSPFDQSLNPLVRGADYGGYPLPRTYTLGLNVTF